MGSYFNPIIVKKLVIAGGNGFLGNVLIDFYRNIVTEIVVLTRSGNTVQSGIIYQYWDAKTPGNWQQHLKDTDVLVNLTGKSVDCRYNQRNKDLIMSSRVDSTKIIVRSWSIPYRYGNRTDIKKQKGRSGEIT